MLQQYINVSWSVWQGYSVFSTYNNTSAYCHVNDKHFLSLTSLSRGGCAVEYIRMFSLSPESFYKIQWIPYPEKSPGSEVISTAPSRRHHSVYERPFSYVHVLRSILHLVQSFVPCELNPRDGLVWSADCGGKPTGKESRISNKRPISLWLTLPPETALNALDPSPWISCR